MPEPVPRFAVVEMPKGTDFGYEDLASVLVHPSFVVIGQFPTLWNSYHNKELNSQ